MIKARTNADGTVSYFKVEHDGTERELNDVERNSYMRAKQHKSAILQKVGGGVAFGGGVAIAESITAVAEVVAVLPAVLTIGAIAGGGYLAYRGYKALKS